MIHFLKCFFLYTLQEIPSIYKQVHLRNKRGKQEKIMQSGEVKDSASDLPQGILVDIFTRLPIKAIFQCKCVCKTWYKLIVSDDHFSTMYSERKPFTHIALMDISYLVSRTGSPYLLEFEGKLDDENRIRMEAMKLRSPKAELLPVGSCKGLFCFVEVYLHYDLFYINNPIPDQYVVLPKANRCSYEETCTVGYGFGFSQLTRQYKVIRIVTQLRVGSEAIAKAEILTFGHGEDWRDLDVSFIQYYFGSCATSLDGILHWIVGKYVCTSDFKRITQISTDLIVGFDIEEETFRTIPLPPALGNQKKQMRLTSLGNRLCIIDNPNMFQIDIWRMEEYGVAESWTRSFIFNNWSPLDELRVSVTPGMIGIPEDEDTILISDVNNHCLVSYNLKDSRWSKFEVRGTVLEGDFLPFAFTPSFVSMNDVLEE